MPPTPELGTSTPHPLPNPPKPPQSPKPLGPTKPLSPPQTQPSHPIIQPCCTPQAGHIPRQPPALLPAGSSSPPLLLLQGCLCLCLRN